MDLAYDLALSGPVGSFEAYQRQVEQYPRLSEEEERRLAHRYRQENDLDAALRLVVSNLRLSLKIARQYQGYGLPLEDLVQEGNVGLMKAVKRFDPSRGVRLFKYAILWIRAEIHDFILRNWRIVRVATSRSKKKLFYKLRGAKKELRCMTADEAAEISDRLDVPVDDVLDMEMRLYSKDTPYDESNHESFDGRSFTRATHLGDARFAPDRLVDAEQRKCRERERLTRALKSLDMRSRDIIMRRWLCDDKATLQELGDDYGLSAERIRQIEKASIEKLRKSMAENVQGECRSLADV